MMKTQRWLEPFVFVLVAGCLTLCAAADGDDQKKQKPKTREVKIKDITLKVLETWKQKPPANRLRLAQFNIPTAEDDKEPTELVVYSFGGGGGGLRQNLPRWTGEFRSQDRRMKLTTGKAPQGEYVVVDIRGTHIGPSFRRRKTPMPNARMLAVILQIEKKGNYFLKMTGPEKTITAAAKSLRASFDGDQTKEKEVKLDDI